MRLAPVLTALLMLCSSAAPAQHAGTMQPPSLPPTFVNPVIQPVQIPKGPGLKAPQGTKFSAEPYGNLNRDRDYKPFELSGGSERRGSDTAPMFKEKEKE